MPLEDGIYIITNVKQRNLVFLENPNNGTPVQGHYRKNDLGEQWRVIDRGNGQHSIQNVDYKSYANRGSLAELGGFVEGHSTEQLWYIQERSKGNYTIAATDTGKFWMLPYNQQGTLVSTIALNMTSHVHYLNAVTGRAKPTDQRCWWSFTNPATEAPVNKDSTDEYILFELTPLPILPFSPLKLDFLIIQEVSEDSISNASRTTGEMCGPLVSSRWSQPGAFCANIIEFRSPSSNTLFFKRFSDFVNFETLHNLEGSDISWTRCGGSSLPAMVMRSLRVDAVKVAILNLNITLLQQGGQSIIALINSLFDQDIRLILTPIQPSWENAFYKGPVFQKLDELSCEYRLFEDKGGFSDYVFDYNDTVALPRLAEDAELRNKIWPNISEIVRVLKDENPEAQLAAVGALSQLAKHADLHDEILKAIIKIVGMLRLRGNNCGAEAAASALIKLAACADLHDIFCHAIPHMTKMLKNKNDDAQSAAAVLSKLAARAELHDTIFQAVLTTVKMLMRDSGKWVLRESFVRDITGCTALLWAAESGYDAVVRLLLVQEGVDVNYKDHANRTPLLRAAGNGHDAAVRLLLAQEGVDVNSKDDTNQTPLSHAAENGHDAVVRLLLVQEGVHINSKDNGNRTPLSQAAYTGHDAIVRLLLAQEGVDVNSKDTSERTPLSLAAGNGRHVVVRLLLAQEGVYVNSKDISKRTPLSWAAENGQDAVLRLLLLQKDVEADSKDRFKQTPLSRAAWTGQDTAVRLLLAEEGVDVNSKDYLNRTPLLRAAWNGRDAVVRLLLAQGGVDVNSKDDLGRTPLSLAAKNGHDAIVRLLLAHGAVDTRRKNWWWWK